MEILKFTLKGKTAFFKMPDVNSYVYFSYGNIHKPALLGIFGAVMGYKGYNHQGKEDYPEYYEKLTVADEITMAIQVNGKVRGSISVERTASKEDIEKMALAVENVQKHTEGKTVAKVIVVPGKIVNIVVK